MKENIKKSLWVFIFSVFLSLFLLFSGLRWGRPSNINQLIFINEEERKSLIGPMTKIYEEIWEEKKFYEDKYRKYNEATTIEFEINGKKYQYKKAIVSCFRSYLLRSYGLDEEVPFNVLRRINIFEKKFNPKYFGYGNLYIYSLGGFLYLGKILKLVELRKDMDFYLNNYKKMTDIYFIGRLFNIPFFILSVFIFYLIIKKLIKEDRFIYYLPVLIFATFPPFILWSHFVSPFIFGLFWGLFSIYFLLRFAENPSKKNLFLLFLLIGIASSVLLTYFFLFPPFFFIAHYKIRKDYFKISMISIFSFFAGYISGNPFILSSFPIFLNEMKWYFTESEYVNYGIKNFLYYFTYTLRIVFGFPLLFVSFFFIIFSFFQKREFKNLLLNFLIFYCLFIFGLKFSLFVRHNFIVYTLILAGISSGLSSLKKEFLHKISAFILSFLFLWIFLYSAALVINLKGENTRDMAGKFINSNLKEGSTIGLIQYPSPWRTPPFQFSRFKIVPVGTVQKDYNKTEYFVFSIIEDPEKRLFGLLSQNYFLYTTFKKDLKIKKIKFLNFSFPNRDWMRINPEIYIWRRK